MLRLNTLTKRGSTTIALIAGVFMAGCAKPIPGSPEAVYQEQTKKEETRVKAVEASVKELPDWYTNLPKDAHSIFATGTATSPDLQLALDKSTLNAKRALADTINSLLSSKMKEFLTEIGQGEDTEVLSEVERVTINLITEVSVTGYSQEDVKVLAQGSKYRAYVLLKYPVGKANRTLVDQVKNNRILEGKMRASKAFKELEDEIEDARKAE